MPFVIDILKSKISQLHKTCEVDRPISGCFAPKKEIAMQLKKRKALWVLALAAGFAAIGSAKADTIVLSYQGAVNLGGGIFEYSYGVQLDPAAQVQGAATVGAFDPTNTSW